MRKAFILPLACMASMLAFGQNDTQTQSANRNAVQPPMLGVQWAQGTPEDNMRQQPLARR